MDSRMKENKNTNKQGWRAKLILRPNLIPLRILNE